jgi:hypothetical protein
MRGARIGDRRAGRRAQGQGIPIAGVVAWWPAAVTVTGWITHSALGDAARAECAHAMDKDAKRRAKRVIPEVRASASGPSNLS